MIDTESPRTLPGVEPIIPTASSEGIAKHQTTAGEHFLRFVVIAVGMLLGAVVALVVGLSAGWIPFNC